ncbi:MAG: MobA/MobL family protein [Lachnospiraceae bacterium]|nr:MobA/MobL family protein [Lachnospiraceae bacterium]
MAIHYLGIKIVTRAHGKSAVAAAAYRSGEIIKSDYDGLTYDYSRKNWIEHKEIILPPYASDKYYDRKNLWNAVEKVENRRDSSLTRDIVLSLPGEMDQDQQLDLVRKFVSKNFVADGYAVDIAIHNPPVTDAHKRPVDVNGRITNDRGKMTFHNPHAHVLIPMRPFNEKGNFEQKSEILYVCKRKDVTKNMTASEFNSVKDEEWQKLYAFQKEGKKVWLTLEEGKEQNLTRKGRNPKTVPYGITNPKISKWNDANNISRLRVDWQNIVNKKFEELGMEERIYSRIKDDPDREYELPLISYNKTSVKLDKNAYNLIKHGMSPDKVKFSDEEMINREIRSHNLMVKNVKKVINDLNKKAESIIKEIAAKLESLRIKWIIARYDMTRNETLLKKMKLSDSDLDIAVDKYYSICVSVQEAEKRSEEKIEYYQRKLDECPAYNIEKKRKLRTLISEEKKKVETRQDYLINMRTTLGFDSEEDYLAKRSIVIKRKEMTDEYKRILSVAQDNANTIKTEYEHEKEKVPESYHERIRKERNNIREEYDQLAMDNLSKYHKEKVDVDLYENFSKELDKDTSIQKVDTKVKEISKSKSRLR